MNPSGWLGVIEVKNPAGATAGYILLYPARVLAIFGPPLATESA